MSLKLLKDLPIDTRLLPNGRPVARGAYDIYHRVVKI